MFSTLDIRVTVMSTVSVDCRRLTQNLVSAPASITAGMVTIYCLQPQKHTHTADTSLGLIEEETLTSYYTNKTTNSTEKLTVLPLLNPHTSSSRGHTVSMSAAEFQDDP